MICAAIALYLNSFVAVVQAFLKVPALTTLAPTQTEAPFVVAQLLVLAFFIALTVAAAKRSEANRSLTAGARAGAAWRPPGTDLPALGLAPALLVPGMRSRSRHRGPPQHAASASRLPDGKRLHEAGTISRAGRVLPAPSTRGRMA